MNNLENSKFFDAFLVKLFSAHDCLGESRTDFPPVQTARPILILMWARAESSRYGRGTLGLVYFAWIDMYTKLKKMKSSKTLAVIFTKFTPVKTAAFGRALPAKDEARALCREFLRIGAMQISRQFGLGTVVVN